ncbi:HypC/HybG/HupF family hydrogenase formation chaperone [Nocardia puris]|uniref:Hydrogenase expression/formation protein HypC n=1 Tax=Nocardia puris TaxID=208602 RepID=A0A366DHA7_9NOCA|nr:HypC/HybG/HupF family hydrogenase formation chaperone [Nocardia puris]MBF6213287.1 HypC/HybG/HupF family hydrogenase formation chaperone [Nocardia puris]MBF6369879.1 HypC/HybG/HupF family hydrogenase formation chaperone [Nocardia puris]MBF6462166.1 HypC/HybG/HupF family hydrogenase formation chaperone [Nocardia puris]RBO89472.1 hydrogenase expression/formation protein HypC [Nocardia puris]
MCLGIPGQVVEIPDGYHGQIAVVDVEGARRQVNIGLLEDDPARPGDWVIIHMGLAVEKTDAEGAARALSGLKLLGRGEVP